MHEEILKECGLTTNESLVYLALLKLGKSKSGQIVKEAGISGGKIYETLNKLIDKGLVKTYIENGIKTFFANSPEMLISYIREKENKLKEQEISLEKVIPQLTSLAGESKITESVELMKGLRALREAVYPILSEAKEIKIMGVNSSKDERYNNFWREWHKERVRRKKGAKVIFSDRNTPYWSFFKRIPFTNTKAITHFSPSATMIIDTHIFVFSYAESITTIHINSRSIAASFSVFFDDLWRIAKP